MLYDVLTKDVMFLSTRRTPALMATSAVVAPTGRSMWRTCKRVRVRSTLPRPVAAPRHRPQRFPIGPGGPARAGRSPPPRSNYPRRLAAYRNEQLTRHGHDFHT